MVWLVLVVISVVILVICLRGSARDETSIFDRKVNEVADTQYTRGLYFGIMLGSIPVMWATAIVVILNFVK